MDDENVKSIRPKRVLKPKFKLINNKAPKLECSVNKKSNSASVPSAGTTLTSSTENGSSGAASEEKIIQKERLPPPGNNVCKKQAIRGTRKLGLFVIDCEEITGERKINLEAPKSFLRQNIKVDGKTNDKRIQIDVQNEQILISAEIFVEQKYIKFLVKKFLKSSKLHNWIKIENGKKTYKLRYFTM